MNDTKHAPSQVSIKEAGALLDAALRSPDHRGSLTLLEAVQVSRSEMLGRWSVDSPLGTAYRVAIIRTVDGEPMAFDEVYRDEADSVAVWTHIRDTWQGDQ